MDIIDILKVLSVKDLKYWIVIMVLMKRISKISKTTLKMNMNMIWNSWWIKIIDRTVKKNPKIKLLS